MQFLPSDIENIILDYKKQFERKYDCSIKHKHELFETKIKKNIIFYKNPYKFECKICKIKICNNHTDSFIVKNTKKDLCINCHMTNIQIMEILKDIEYNKNELINYIKSFKNTLFYFKDKNLIEVNKKLKTIYNNTGQINVEDMYNTINYVYKNLNFFDFFEVEN